MTNKCPLCRGKLLLNEGKHLSVETIYWYLVKFIFFDAMIVPLYDMYNDFRNKKRANDYKELYSYSEKL